MFSCVEEMDATIVSNINERCGKKDDLFILGDVSFRGAEETGALLERLQPKLHLVAGNHDSNQILRLSVWKSVQPYLKLKDNGRIAILSHFPFAAWDRSHYGSFHLHGHLHGRMENSSQRCDVGADPMNFRPVTLDEAIGVMAQAPAHIDPHG